MNRQEVLLIQTCHHLAASMSRKRTLAVWLNALMIFQPIAYAGRSYEVREERARHGGWIWPQSPVWTPSDLGVQHIVLSGVFWVKGKKYVVNVTTFLKASLAANNTVVCRWCLFYHGQQSTSIVKITNPYRYGMDVSLYMTQPLFRSSMINIHTIPAPTTLSFKHARRLCCRKQPWVCRTSVMIATIIRTCSKWYNHYGQNGEILWTGSHGCCGDTPH